MIYPPNRVLSAAGQPQSFPPALPDRGGLGPARSRGCIYPALRDCWYDSIAIHLNVANGATEVGTSRELSQPFRVDGVSVSAQDTGATDFHVIVALLRDNPAIGSAGDPVPRALWDVANETLSGRLIQGNHLDGWFPLNHVARNVPTRLALLVQNSSGGALSFVARFSVCFLAPHAHEAGAGDLVVALDPPARY